MAIRASISKGVAAADVPRRVSPEFREAIDLHHLRDGTFTVLSFPGMRGESSSIVDSKTLSKALSKCPPDAPIVAVAHNFTAESRELLSGLNAQFFFTSDFFWTDERWAEIRDKR